MTRQTSAALLLAVAAALAAGCGGGDGSSGGGKSRDESAGGLPKDSGPGPSKEAFSAAGAPAASGDAADSSDGASDGAGGDAPDLEKAAADASAAYKQMNKGKDVRAVDPAAIKALLPEKVGDAERRNLKTERVNQMGADIAMVRCDYEAPAPADDDGSNPRPSYQVVVTDIGNLTGAMAMGMTAWSLTTRESTTDTGWEKIGKYRGMPCEERYDREAKDGALKVIVGKRFILDVSGSNTTIEAIRAVVDSVDAAKLEALAK